ncbi:MAG: uracil phosphoribosyltransferase [Clostridiales bacterium]|nr:uracil phosphoribosyltransferase [Clostridiales bacterium]
MSNLHLVEHPLIAHKLTLLRDKTTGVKEFREAISELAMLLCYEATRDLPLKEVEVQTPMAVTRSRVISGKKLALVPILRAGIGMVDGILSLVPAAKVGHIGVYRDHETVLPVEYYCKLPEDIADREVIVLDPMLATGGTAVAAIRMIRERGVRHIKLMNIIAAPEGVRAMQEAFPDVEIYCAALDERLDENAYIIPGLGDAGDRLFGTK